MTRAVPRIATMIGDPAGVGPEVTVKALATGEPQRVSQPVLIGDIIAIERACTASGVALEFEVVSALEAAAFDGRVVVVDPGTVLPGSVPVGAPSPAGGHAVDTWMKLADQLAADGQIDGWIMAPVDSTSLKLAKVCQDIDDLQPAGTYMFRISGPLRIVPLSEHIPLSAVPDTLTPEKVREVVELLGSTLRRWGVSSPRIGVAGLNPHAMGKEDRLVLAPTVKALAAEGWDCTGPVAPDSIFRQAIEGKYDAVVSMYHDQGQIALKSAAFAGACTIYMGLPYIRLTIPHGTAMDIAGTGKAQHFSMLAAMNTAAALSAGNGFLDWRALQPR